MVESALGNHLHAADVLCSVTAIQKRDSLAYVNAMFDAGVNGESAFPVDDLDAPALPVTDVVKTIPTVQGGGWVSRRQQPPADATIAQITMTSRTTGTPKPILLSHDALKDVVTRLVDVMEMDADISEYVGVPVSYSFGPDRLVIGR